MATVTDNQNNFTAGEIGARLYGQTTLTAYRNGARKLENMLTWVQGGAYARNGTRYIAEVKDSSAKVRLVRFQFSTTQTYVLEFGNLYMRVYRDQGQVLDGSTPYEIETPYLTADLFQLKFAQSADVMYIAHPDYKPRKLSRTGHTAWTLAEESFIDGPYLSRGGYDGDELIPDGTFTDGTDIDPFVDLSTGDGSAAYTSSSNDSMRIQGGTSGTGIAEAQFTVTNAEQYILSWYNEPVSGTMSVRVGTTSGADDNLTAANYTSDGKKTVRFTTSSTTIYVQFRSVSAGGSVLIDKVSLKQEDKTLELTGASVGDYLKGEGVTMTAKGGSPFVADHVGSFWRLREKTGTADPESMWVEVIEYTDSQNVNVQIRSDAPDALDGGSGDATTWWYEGAWSEHRGWPVAVTLYEQRLMFGGTAHQPQTIWGSKGGDFPVFSPAGTIEGEDGSGDLTLQEDTIQDDDALSYTAATGDVVSVRWLQDNGEVLLIGTNGGLLTMSGSSLNEAVSPNNVMIRRNNTTRAADIQPAQLNSDVFFVEEGGRKLHLVARQTEFDRYSTEDLTLFAHHILGTGVVEIDSMQRPTPSIWCVRNDGVLATLTYEPKQQVAGWQRQVIAGTDAAVESIAIIPSTASTYSDEVWLSVKRTVDGETVRYIEMLELQDWESLDTEDFFYVDSGLTYDGSPATTISGLDHLEGETVRVLADGYLQADKTVASGSITLDTAASVVQAGLAYTPKIETLRLELSGALGDISQGKRRSIHKLHLLLHQSIGGTYGTDASSLDEVSVRDVGDDVGAPPPLFSGLKHVYPPARNDTEGYLTLTQDKPYPFAVLGMYPEVSPKRA